MAFPSKEDVLLS